MGKNFLFLSASLFMLLLASCNLPSTVAVTPSQTISTVIPTSISATISPTAEPSATKLPASPTSEPTQPAVPAWTPAAKTERRYAVILVEEDDVLNIRSGAGTDNGIIGHFAADEKNVLSTGKVSVANGQVWLEAKNPSGGTGWVNAWYLTEFVSKQDFCTDSRVDTLLNSLKQAVNDEDGDLLGSLVSPAHGLELYYWRGGNTANYTPEEASWVFKSTYKFNWGSGPSGMDDIGTFREFPLPSLQEVLNAEDLELQCNDSGSASMYVEPWPQMYSNVRFYALYKPGTPDVDLDWGIWLAGVEYVEGEPYLFALIRFVWEP